MSATPGSGTGLAREWDEGPSSVRDVLTILFKRRRLIVFFFLTTIA
jgi:hypothetical protein